MRSVILSLLVVHGVLAALSTGDDVTILAYTLPNKRPTKIGFTPILNKMREVQSPSRVTLLALNASPVKATAASVLKLLGPRFQTIGLLLCSNLFMTFAWYGHLKKSNTGGPHQAWYIAAILSWGLAFFEYILQVPANKIGFESGVFTLAQLKILQEVLSLGIFVPFSILFMKNKLTWNYLWASLCMLGAAFFTFKNAKLVQVLAKCCIGFVKSSIAIHRKGLHHLLHSIFEINIGIVTLRKVAVVVNRKAARRLKYKEVRREQNESYRSVSLEWPDELGVVLFVLSDINGFTGYQVYGPAGYMDNYSGLAGEIKNKQDHMGSKRLRENHQQQVNVAYLKRTPVDDVIYRTLGCKCSGGFICREAVDGLPKTDHEFRLPCLDVYLKRWPEGVCCCGFLAE
eukprot:gene838-1631_t